MSLQSARIALRPACNSPNAYSLPSALHSTFATSSKRRDAGVQGHVGLSGPRHNQPSSPGREGGSFASYEALSQKFVQQVGREGATPDDAGSRARKRGPSLAARQILVDAAVRTDRGKGQNGKPTHLHSPRARPLVAASPLPRLRAPQTPESHSSRIRYVAKPLGTSGNPRSDADPDVRPLETGPDGWKSHMQWIGRTVNELSRPQASGHPRKVTDTLRQALDYKPKSLTPRVPDGGNPVAFMPIPWAASAAPSRNSTSSKEVLDWEIEHFVAHIEPTPAEAAARKAIIADACAISEDGEEALSLRTEVFGSEVTGLALAASDIDIRLYQTQSPQNRQVSKKQVSTAIEALSKRLRMHPEWTCVVFRHAKFPIINAQHRATGIDVQFVGSPPTNSQQDWTRKYLAELPHLRSLYLLLRTVLGVRGLLDVFNGGIGSYGLLMMLAAALKRRSKTPPKTAAGQLHRFLTLAKSIDTTRHALTLSPTAKLFLKHGRTPELKSYIEAAHRRQDPIRAGQWAIGQTRPLQPYLLCLQDPADPTNDLGRKSNAIKYLLTTLKELALQLRADQVRMKAVMKAKQMPKMSLLEPLVGRCHELYFDRRAKVEVYGREVLARHEKEDSRRERGEVETGEKGGKIISDDAPGV